MKTVGGSTADTSPGDVCACSSDGAVCCEAAAELLRRLRFEFELAIVSGQWFAFNTARRRWTKHRARATAALSER